MNTIKKIGMFIIAIMGLNVREMSAETIGGNERNAGNKRRDNDFNQRDRMNWYDSGTARSVLRTTASIIISARKAVRNNRVFTGNLSLAVQHQKYALSLFDMGAYNNAISHSLRARSLAQSTMKDNRYNYNIRNQRNEAERKWEFDRRTFPSNNDLDKRVNMMHKDKMSEWDIIRDRNLNAEIDIMN